MVIAYHMVQRGVEKGREEGRAEGRVEGRAEGRAEAYKDINRQNAAYFKRMRAALDAGEDFDEPPPKFGNDGK